MIEADGADALRAELGADPPAELLERLDDAELSVLAGLVAAAKDHQVDELARGGEAALGIVPRLLRAPLRGALGS